ncbi:hypothetical protein [Mesorhizobium silamurunense]|uniref:hypothetical protein n=1 Tax=Mesorhizobium silamurunense TaxID=499528 RepID=UPI00178707CF|nr:hypothetical protein [Mesorhizobium silamurunense]
MISLLFAGIKISPFTAGHLMPKLLTQEVIFSAENWPVFDRNGGRLRVGIRTQEALAAEGECWAGFSAGRLPFQRHGNSSLRPVHHRGGAMIELPLNFLRMVSTSAITASLE